jgi:hypothetical protein
MKHNEMMGAIETETNNKYILDFKKRVTKRN